MIDFIVRLSASLTMLALAIVFYNIFPHNPFNNDLIIGLLFWFVCFGPFRWIERRIVPFVENRHDSMTWGYLFLGIEITLIIIGLMFLVGGCLKLG